MGLWMPRKIIFLLLLCGAGGQIDSFQRWRPHWLREFRFPLPIVSPEARFTLLGPDLLRTDSPENLFLQADGVTSPVTCHISIQDFAKTRMLLEDSVTLDQANKFQALKPIQLSSEHLNRAEKKNKFVYLKVNFGDHHTEERVLMVSFHSGYIFIQTDKPIYNPGDTAKFRAFVSSPTFKAFDSAITIDLKGPDGVVVKQMTMTKAVNGILADFFRLSDIVSEGTWTVIAMFDHWPQNKFTSRFEVKKYVLPAFNVTLMPRKSYLDLDDRELEVEISARYLFGEPVQGTAYVTFGVKINEERIRLPSVKQVSNLEGGVVSLSMEEIKRVHPNIRTLVGESVYVKASVLTKSGSDLVEVEKTGIKIVESPYVISFKDMTKYYKPSLPFDLTVELTHHDGSLVHNVPVKVNLLEKPLAMSLGSTRVTINMPSAGRLQTIIAETVQANLRPEQQAKHQVTVQPYISRDRRRQNYLYISKGFERVSVGETLSLMLTISTANLADRDLIKHLTYLVLNKGKIISAQRVDATGQFVTSIGLIVTPEMLPSFRFVAFYSIPSTTSDEFVSDSIWIDVVDSCAGGLTVGTKGSVQQHYKPGKNIILQVRGDPGANVSLVAVDNAVYLLNKDRLTQGKIWDVVEQGDIGCNRGGGRDAGQVFSNAGMLFSSSTGFKTITRQTLQCTSTSRRGRSAEQHRRKAQLESHYKEKLQHRCCKDGLRDIPMPYSCTRRSIYITEGWECIQAFRYCCGIYRNQEIPTEFPTTPPPPMTTSAPFMTGQVMFHERLFVAKRPMTAGQGGPRQSDFIYTMEERRQEDYTPIAFAEEEELEYAEESDVYLRFRFLESWLWIDLKLPTQAEEDGLASTEVMSVLPDSITEWGITAISASPQTGFCVAEPFNFKTWKQFFVDLKLPYSVARNEQVVIKAVIHNYGSEDLHVMVVLMKTENMCSVAFKDRHTQEVMVPVGSSVAIPYTIIPFVVGRLPLEVMVLARDMMGSDRVQKPLRVVLDGVQKTEVWTTVLNPSAHGGNQRVRMGKIELKSVVPNSRPETFINIRGNLLADSIDNSISENSLASLIQMPGGCVEQNLASITLPLIATLYLERTNGWESVGVDRKAVALRYIREGFENQLVYKKPDGSYPPYRREGASTWITAYVVKVFSMAHSIIGINEKQVCDPLHYLIENKLNLYRGHYAEDNPVYSTTMTGGMRGDDPVITLTAFVLIALTEAKQAGIICDDPQINIKMYKTADYLKGAIKRTGRRPYTVAIAAYALAMMENQGKYNPMLNLMRAAAPDRAHWPDRQNALFTLEATGYALLALVKLGHMEEAAAPFQWLNSQRKKGGGFGSTQSTMVVLQALSEYMIHTPPPSDVVLDVDLHISGRREIRYHFNPRTSYTARSSRLPADLEFWAVAQGSGQGIIEVVTHYNQMHDVDEKFPCSHFELSVALEESSEKPPADVEKSFQITIKVRALGPEDVRMVILDISLPTGFTPENSDLEMLSNSVDRYVNHFQIVDNLSDRGSLILHLFKVSHKEPDILLFRLQQNFRVGLLQPSSVTVYEYYSPDRRCSRTYTPSEDIEALTQICSNNECRCAQGDCCVSKTDSEIFGNKQRETFACKSLHHVFKVNVLGVTRSYYDEYEMEITQVIKLGLESGVQVGQRRIFMSHGGCRHGLNLNQGSQYLIIGPKEDLWNIDSETDRSVYMLGKNTWVERWPALAESSSNPSLQAKLKRLNAAAYDLSVNGCWL